MTDENGDRYHKQLHIGLELPPPVQEVLADLDPQIPKVRWLPAEELHLTLSSLGNVGTSQQEVLGEALGKVRVAPFFLPLAGMGTFSAGGSPSVLWIGTGKGHPHLYALHRQLQDALLRVGMKPDLRAFVPHVTVARCKGLAKKAIEPFLQEHREGEFALIKVNGFAVYSTEEGLDGPMYRREMQFVFEGT